MTSIQLGQQVRTLLRGMISAALLCLFSVSLTPAFAAATNYVDPIGYPGSWPADSEWIPYTSSGSNISDPEGGSGGDTSTGGTNPSGAVDIVADYGPAVSWYTDGSNLYFRMQLADTPLQANGTSRPFTSATWNILLDVDGDGYKEFVVHIDGTGSGQTQPDDIVVIYDDNPTQAFTVSGGANDTIWRQDSADNPSDTGSQSVDGEPISNNINVWDNDGSPGGPNYDFTRSRIIDINGSTTYLDFQVPLAALDAASQGGPTFTTTTPFAMGFSTSNSNSDPVQKDLAYAGDYTAVASAPFPTGDLVNPTGVTLSRPIIQSFTASGCGPTSLSTRVLDATKIVGGQVVSTASAEFYYYYDANSDGIANDPSSGWYKAGDGIPTNGLAPWTLSWDSRSLASGQYLLKVIARDDQGNVVDSSTLSSPLIQIHDNACSTRSVSEVVDIANSSNAAGMGSEAVNADPATSITTTKPVIRTQSTSFNLFIRNEGSLAQSYGLAVDADGAGAPLPAGITVVFKDTGGNVINATPSLNPGDTYQYQAEVSTTASAAYGNQSLYFYANGIDSDVKQDAIAVAPGVDIANSASATGLGDYTSNADPASAVTTTETTLPGWTVSFDLFINNESGINQAFDLSYTEDAGSPLTGWTVVFKDSAGNPITSTPVIAAGQTYQFSAEVTSDAGAADATYPIFFHADGASVAAASDVKQDAVTIDSGLSTNVVDLAISSTASGLGEPGINANPDSTVSSTVYVEPGNVAVFNLSISNEGGANKVFNLDAFANNARNNPDPLSSGWTVVFKDSGNNVITQTPSLAPGDTFNFTAEVTVPTSVTDLLKPLYFRADAVSAGGGNWNTDFLLVEVQASALADLSIVKTVDNNQPQQGDTIVYTLTLTNNGPKNANQIEVTDVLPAGLTYVSDDGGGTYDNVSGLWTPGLVTNGSSATLNITLTVNPGTGGSTITNTATITGSNRTDPDSSNDTSSVDLDVVAPNVLFLKSVQTISDPFSSANPKAIPGSILAYTVMLTNQGLGTADADSIVITDAIPGNTEMFVDDLGGAGSGPVQFIDGSPPVDSGLSYTFPGDLEFSNNGGATWTYSPSDPDGDGFDPNITNIRINPKGVMNASDGTNHPTFMLRFRVRVQ